MKISSLLAIVSISILTACSTVNDDKQLLPDSGATTQELIQGTHTERAFYGTAEKSAFIGDMITPRYQSNSSFSNRHIQELQRDFKKVPNPEIIAYVYPHLNNNQMPVPGYFTSFQLYERNHYALTAEGYNEN